MKQQTLIVVGGVAAGMSAASKAKRDNPDLVVRVYEKGPHIAYGQCGLPYYLAGHLQRAEDVVVRKPAAFEEQGIEVHLFHEAVSLDAASKQITLRSQITGTLEAVAYDFLVIATGAEPKIPPLPGSRLPGVTPLKTIPDAETIEGYLADPAVREVVLVGGGYVNVEMAEAAVMRGKRVRIIQRPHRLLNHMDPEFGQEAGDELARHGVALHLEETVEAFTGESSVNGVVTDKGRYPADLVVVALGVQPGTGWLKTSGLALLENGAIRVDARGQTNLPDVYAAGDCASVFHRVMGRDVYLPLGTTANKQGRLTGAAIAGKPISFGGILGTSIVKVMDKTLGKTGLSGKEAEREKLSFDSVTVKGRSHAGSYPGSEEVMLKLVWEKESRRLLGAQICGPVEGAKRLDVLALAIHCGMEVDELASVDFCYAPPYATVWDVVQVAAKAAGSIGKEERRSEEGRA